MCSWALAEMWLPRESFLTKPRGEIFRCHDAPSTEHFPQHSPPDQRQQHLVPCSLHGIPLRAWSTLSMHPPSIHKRCGGTRPCCRPHQRNIEWRPTLRLNHTWEWGTIRNAPNPPCQRFNQLGNCTHVTMRCVRTPVPLAKSNATSGGERERHKFRDDADHHLTPGKLLSEETQQ